jgi:hypothetical protein
VAERTVREYVHGRRRERGEGVEAFVSQVHAAGVEAEVDWGEAQVAMAALRSHYLYESQFTIAGIEGAHVEAFDWFGGVFGLHPADFLPGVWVADDETQALRRQVARRAHIVRQRTRLKNQVQSILHRNLIEKCPASDLFGIKGRTWLAGQPLPADELQAVDALLRQLDFQGQELRIIDAALAKVALVW